MAKKTTRERKESAKEVLERLGATEIEGYCLISNYGYTFAYKGKRYDARYWANCYGAALNVWKIHSLNPREDDDRFVYPVDPKIEKKFETALNKSAG